jgi:hypothetical protein
MLRNAKIVLMGSIPAQKRTIMFSVGSHSWYQIIVLAEAPAA